MNPAGGPDQETRDRLYDILRDDVSFEEKARNALALTTEYLGMDAGYVTRVDQETGQCDVLASTGSAVDSIADSGDGTLSETYCRQTIDGTVLAIQDATSEGLRDDQDLETRGHRSYLGVALVIDEEPFGTVSFVSDYARDKPYSFGEIRFTEQVTRLLERELDIHRVEAAITEQANAATESTRMPGQDTRNDASVIPEFTTPMADELDTDSHSEAIYEAAFDAASDAMIIVNTDGTIVMANPAAADLFGLDHQAVLGRSHNSLLPEGFDADTAWQRLQSGGTPRDTMTISGADGVERTVHYAATANIVPGQHLFVIRDVTDQRERERELARFKKAVESSSHAIYMTDIDGTITYVNPAFESMTSYAAEEAIGRTPQILQSGEHEDTFYDDLWETILGGDAWRGKIINATKDGEEYIVDQTISPIANEDGEITDFVAVNTDITERELQKRNLERYRAVFKEAGDGMTITDDDGCIRDVNEEAARIYDEAKEQLIGRSMREFLPNDFDFEAEWGEIQAAKMKRDEMPIVSADGGVTSIEYTAVTDVVPGQHLIVSRDISDRKSRERKLERDVERLDQFASVLSHDLRNPLNVAQTRLELASSEYESKHFAPIERAHDRMETLIDDLLTLARQGPEEADFEPIELSTLASDCWGTVQSADATLEIETDQTIEADSNQLKQLFENLFSNAVYHGGDDVTVTVVQLDSGFAVEDDGPGIPAKDREQVFDAGFSSDQDGTGFGLSIVQQAARVHDWDLTVTEGSNGGARFEITGVEFVDE